MINEKHNLRNHFVLCTFLCEYCTYIPKACYTGMGLTPEIVAPQSLSYGTFPTVALMQSRHNFNQFISSCNCPNQYCSKSSGLPDRYCIIY